MKCLLVFNGIFSTNRLYCAMSMKYIVQGWGQTYILSSILVLKLTFFPDPFPRNLPLSL